MNSQELVALYRSIEVSDESVERVLDVEGLRSRIEKLEHEAADPNLWDDQARAQRVTSELSHTQGELRRVEELRQRLDDLPVLYDTDLTLLSAGLAVLGAAAALAVWRW